jgi:hypothetical protein
MTENSQTTKVERELETYFLQGEPRTAFVIGLRQQLLNQAARSNVQQVRRHIIPRWMNLQPARRYFAVGVLVLCLVIIAIGPQRVLAAIQGWIGYVPGLGFVLNPDTARVLDQPVTVTQDGVSVTVVDAVADEANTRILLKAEGIRNLWKNGYSDTADLILPPAPRLSYLGGSLVLDHYSQVALGNYSVSLELVYPPLAKGVDDPVLSFQRIPFIPKSIAPENWSISLRFKVGSSSGRITTTAEQVTASDTQNGITLILESEARMQDKDALRVSMTSALPGTKVEYDGLPQLMLWDIDGHPVPFINQRIYDPPYVTVVTFSSQRLVPNQFYTLTAAGPVELSKLIPAGDPQVEFTVDLGQDPQIGQSWAVDQTVSVDGKQIHIRSVRMALDGIVLIFSVDPQDGMSGVTIEPIPASPTVILNLRGVTAIQQDGSLKHRDPMLYYRDAPKGKLTFRISAIDTFVQGPWTLTWKMPELSVQP